MRNSLYILGLLTISWTTPALATDPTVADYFSNCARPSDSGGRVLTVDPNRHGVGSYSDIAGALQVAKPGDTISLMTGDYGNLALNGINQGAFISIVGAKGQTPKFTNIFIGGFKPASRWRLSHLTISGFVPSADKKAQATLIVMANSDNIVIDDSDLYAQDGVIDWQALVPAKSPTNGVPNGISARQSSCVTIVNNRLRNIFNGIDFGGDQIDNHGQYFLIGGNSIDNFAGDGIDHYASHVRIEENRITNGHDICNNTCVHNDGIQGWNYNRLPVLNSDVTIESNVIVAQTRPDLELPVDTLQGITIFDGKWADVKILNNLVVANAWHGISLYGVDNAAVINNTVAPTNPSRNTWIMMHAAKGEPAGTAHSAVFRNNIFPGVINPRAPKPPGLISDHNLALRTADDFKDAFVKFDPEHFSYDLHLAKGSDAIGEGSSEEAPKVDIEGHLREAPFDIGAYAHQKK